jgi:hypothetical protein
MRCGRLHQASSPQLDLQRQHPTLECGRRAGCPGSDARGARAGERVNQIADKMRLEYRRLGFDIGDSVTPVIPIIIGDDDLTFLTWKLLFENGVFVNPVISPAVSPGRQLLRTSYMATHTDEQLERVLEIFAVVGKQLGFDIKDKI